MDLAVLTIDLASVFRSACQKEGIDLIVTCPPLCQTFYVDTDMWEKIVLNLLSNAFKFTFKGNVTSYFYNDFYFNPLFLLIGFF